MPNDQHNDHHGDQHGGPSPQSITISGGGSMAIATDSMLASARALTALADDAHRWRQEIEHSARSAASAAGSGHNPGRYLFSATRSVGEVETRSAHLRDSLHRAADLYGWAEHTATQVLEAAGSMLGYGVGAAAPLIGWLLLGALPGAALALGASSLITGSPRNSLSALSRWAGENRGLLRNPAVVAFVRQAVSATDDGMLGFARVPYPIARALDDGATGLFGVRGAASTVIGLGGGRILAETPVVVRQVPTGPTAASAAAPTGFSDLAARIPSNAPGGPQVRIERYDVDGERPRWVVYTGGTIDQGFAADGEPWDDTSNIHGVAQQDAASVRATRDALRAAGAEPGDDVLPVGYSQGGIVATQLVIDGDFQTPELVTFGSPTGQLDVPAGVTNVAVEHRDDVIPALGGVPRSPAHGGLDRILVQRTTYDTPPPLDSSPLAAHHIGVYAQTATQMDQSHDPRLLGARDTLAHFTKGASAQVTMWRADRVSDAG